MELTRKETGFGISVKSGKGLVAELYRTGKVIVFEKAYGDALAKLAPVHTLTNSHSGKTNWTAKLDEAKTEAFLAELAKMEFIHTAGVSKAKATEPAAKKAEPKAKAVKAAPAKKAAQTKKAATTKR